MGTQKICVLMTPEKGEIWRLLDGVWWIFIEWQKQWQSEEFTFRWRQTRRTL